VEKRGRGRKATSVASVSKISKKSTNSHSGESKGLDGGKHNINSNLKKKTAATLSSVVTAITFDDLRRGTCTSSGLEKQPQRGHNNKRGLNVYKSTILGQAIGKLLEKKILSPPVPVAESDVEGDVEDELSETDVSLNSTKASIKVRKSPEKKDFLKKNGIHNSSSSSSKKSPQKFDQSRYRRAAASKASDRINRESRGRLSLSSSSSDDLSDLEPDKKETKNKMLSDDSDFEPKHSEPKPVKIALKRKLSSSMTTTTTTTPSLESNNGGQKAKKVNKAENEAEKENSLKNSAKLSWPEQLARSKAARAASDRNSVDSMDSLEMELAATTATSKSEEPTALNDMPKQKKAIILPILGKKKPLPLPAPPPKESTIVATAVTEVKRTPETGSLKKRGPGRPKKTCIETPRYVNNLCKLFLPIGVPQLMWGMPAKIWGV
jgi:hypothetical protein